MASGVSTTITVILVGFWLAWGLALESVLLVRQWRHLADQVNRDNGPHELHQRIKYNQCRALLRWATSGELAVRIVLWLPGGLLLTLVELPSVDDWFDGVLAVMLFVAVDQLLQQPLRWTRWLAVERGFGMSNVTVAAMLRDTIVSICLRIGLAGGLAGCVLWPFLLWSTVIAWPTAVLLGLVATLIVFGVSPNVIAPMFNRFSSLPTGALRTRLEDLMQRCDAHLADVRVIDNSRRSQLANAYLTGLGHRKSIVLFDTLITRLAPAELEAVLAHELGHFKCGHLHRYYGLLVGLVTCVWLLVPVFQYQVLTLPIAPVPTAITIYLLLPALGWPLRPMLARVRRRYEYEADAYATFHAEPEALYSALKKIFANNLDASSMDPWYADFYATHPPVAERLANISLHY